MIEDVCGIMDDQRNGQTQSRDDTSPLGIGDGQFIPLPVDSFNSDVSDRDVMDNISRCVHSDMTRSGPDNRRTFANNIVETNHLDIQQVQSVQTTASSTQISDDLSCLALED